VNQKDKLEQELKAIKSGGKGLPLNHRSGRYIWPIALVFCWPPILLIDDLTMAQQAFIFLACILPISFIAGKLVEFFDSRAVKKKLSKWN
jgi:hypothetical protein